MEFFFNCLSFWMLPLDQTLHSDHSFSLNNSGMHVAQTQTSSLHGGYICSNCVASHSDGRDALQAYSSSKPCSSSSCSYSSAALHSTAVDGASSATSAAFSSPHTTVYSRERSRRHRAGERSRCSLYRSAKVWECVMWFEHFRFPFFASTQAAHWILQSNNGEKRICSFIFSWILVSDLYVSGHRNPMCELIMLIFAFGNIWLSYLKATFINVLLDSILYLQVIVIQYLGVVCL